MDATAVLALALLERIKHPIRVPTAQWLLSDVYGLLDCDARAAIAALDHAHHVSIDNAGWIRIARNAGRATGKRAKSAA